MEKIKNNEKCPIDFTLFKDIFDDDIKLNDLINEYNSNIDENELKLIEQKSRNRWIIEFPYKILYKYIKSQTDSICKIINDILSKENIKTIIFVGGYCYNKVLLELIKKGLKNNLTPLQPSRPCLSIMEGAVLFGIEPSTINIRKSKYTIGAGVNDFWDDKRHSEKGTKILDEELNKYRCKDCFDKFFEINQSINLDEKITKSYYTTDQNQFCEINFYKTLKPDPVFTFEEGVIFLGKCEIDAGKEYKKIEDREINVTMKFGGTFIDVSAIHIKSGNAAKVKLLYI